jgi:hypothetical protein
MSGPALVQPVSVPGLLACDRMRPRITKTESRGGFLGDEFIGSFNDGAQRVAHHAGVFPVGVVNAPKLVAGFRNRARFHAEQFTTKRACEDVAATQNARTVREMSFP